MRTGERCQCGGRMRTYKTRTQGCRRTRYLKCDLCGETGKEPVRLDAEGYPIRVPAAGTHFVETMEQRETMSAWTEPTR
ncbi:hypothetical protein Mal65_53390 [Crateriforma conspicua]|nr:hypothetical protein Mal65_53390 [Crateriforma conspicua]